MTVSLSPKNCPRRVLGKSKIRILNQRVEMAIQISGLRRGAAWARRAGMISYLPRSLRAVTASLTPIRPCSPIRSDEGNRYIWL